jgi:glycosyltransferase involved in cell wall biosynthesis
MNILAHTCFIGTTGYANHARSFFTALNKYHTIKVRNDTVGKAWSGYNKTPHDKESYLTNEMKMMLFSQTLLNNDNTRSDFPIYSYSDDFKPDVHIVLSEMNSQYFYENYDGYKIAYNVWESTRYPDIFFQRLLYFDEVWVPSKWQKDNLIDQGYPQHKIFIVPEGVDHEVFKPIEKLPNKKRFRFLLFGRWEYRKATTEIIRAFGETFKGLEDKVELICSVENPYPYDGFTTTNQRVKHNKLDYKNVRYIEFPSRKEYIKYLQEGDIFVSCSRSEGWFLPLIESMSCGTPSIYSDWGAQLEYAQHKGIPVNIIGLTPANFEHKDWPGDYCEPDFNDLSKKMLLVYENYGAYKAEAIEESKIIRDNFNWDAAAQKASSILTKTNKKNFAFVTTGDIGYMPVIEQLVYSLLEFSKADVLVYGVNCEVPFSYSNVIKRTITPPTHSKHDKWYWKQHACIEATKENYDFLIWIDGDVVVNYNIDNIQKYFNQIVNYPLSDIHVQRALFNE